MSDYIYKPKPLDYYALKRIAQTRLEVIYGLDTLVQKDSVFEIVALGVAGEKSEGTQVARFNSAEKAGGHVASVDATQQPKGLYLVLNPLADDITPSKPAELFWVHKKNPRANDKDIGRIRWLFLDIDPVREEGFEGCMANEHERQAAADVAEDILDTLSDEYGWPEPVQIDSGNGRYLLYSVDLPNTPESKQLLKNATKAISMQFSGQAGEATVDPSVSNASRLIRIPYTKNRKGEDTEDRPHRYASIVKVPETLQNVWKPALEELVRQLAPNLEESSLTGDWKFGDLEKVADSLKDAAEDVVARCQKYIAKMPDAISGQGGHNATFCAACECFRFGLSPRQARDMMFWFNANKTRGDHWTKTELLHKLNNAFQAVMEKNEFGTRVTDATIFTRLTEAGVEVPQEQAEQARQQQIRPRREWRRGGVFANWEESEYLDANGEAKQDVRAVPMADLITEFFQLTGGWPKKCQGTLFVDDSGKILHLEKQDSFFAWAQKQLGTIDWRKSSTCATKGEFYAAVRNEAPECEMISDLPHHPPIKAAHYRGNCCSLGNGEGKYLQDLLDRFSPATEADRDLMLAALLTPAWGVLDAPRPLFLITSDHGRGAGKTATAQVLSEVYGGAIEFQPGDDVPNMIRRILTPTTYRLRCCLMDNVKSHRFSWGPFEALVTTRYVNGHRMYVGDARRPNDLTWFITLNGASLSKDIAQRTVTIKLKRPRYSGSWIEETRAYVETHRWKILADVLAKLRSSPPHRLEETTRWGAWERSILELVSDPNRAQKAIRERQEDADSDNELARLIEDGFRERLYAMQGILQCNIKYERVFIPTAVAAIWWSEITKERETTIRISRQLRQMIREGEAPLLEEYRRDSARGFAWVGEMFDPDQEVNTKLTVDVWKTFSGD